MGTNLIQDIIRPSIPNDISLTPPSDILLTFGLFYGSFSSGLLNKTLPALIVLPT
jgi:hypothetical protein